MKNRRIKFRYSPSTGVQGQHNPACLVKFKVLTENFYVWATAGLKPTTTALNDPFKTKSVEEWGEWVELPTAGSKPAVIANWVSPFMQKEKENGDLEKEGNLWWNVRNEIDKVFFLTSKCTFKWEKFCLGRKLSLYLSHLNYILSKQLWRIKNRTWMTLKYMQK